MGYIRHNAIVVTGAGYPEAYNQMAKVHAKALELFDYLVSPLIEAKINGYQSFLIAPDGSKEEWDESNVYNDKRRELANFIDALAYNDGSNCIQFVDVGFDERFDTTIDQTNQTKVGIWSTTRKEELG